MSAVESPQPIVDQKPRCWRCDRVLFGYAARPWQVKCQRCNAVNTSVDSR